MNFFDSHAHYNDERFLDIRDKLIEDMYNDEITNIVCAGYNLEASKDAIELAKRYPHVFTTCGISPNDITENVDKELLEIEKIAKYEKNVAIGEIGLDYYWNKDNKELQKQVFIKQIEMANRLDLPIVIHTREAVMDTVQILKDTPEYRIAQRRCDLFKNKWITDPVILGKFPDDLLPLLKESGIDTSFVKQEDLDLLATTHIDFLGQNCYTRTLARPYREEDGETNYYPNNVGAGQKRLEGYVVKNWFTSDHDLNNPMNAWGREEYPKTVYDMLMGIKKDYGDIPVYITENGCAMYEKVEEDGKIHDQRRIDFMKGYLDWLVKAENEGCNVKGYYAWSTTDCYSWINGYEKRYGLVYIDYESEDLKRIPKDSYYWFKDYIKEHTEGE